MLDELGLHIKDLVLSEMDFSKELDDDEIYDLIAEIVSREVKGNSITFKERAGLEKAIFYSLRKLDVLQELVDDPEISEIMVNGPDNIFYREKGTDTEV